MYNGNFFVEVSLGSKDGTLRLILKNVQTHDLVEAEDNVEPDYATEELFKLCKRNDLVPSELWYVSGGTEATNLPIRKLHDQVKRGLYDNGGTRSDVQKLADYVEGTFCFAYGDSPAIDWQTVVVPALSDKEQTDIQNFSIEGEGYKVYAVTDEYDGDTDYIMITAFLSNMAMIDPAALLRDMESAADHFNLEIYECQLR